jgi:hypothetical protein
MMDDTLSACTDNPARQISENRDILDLRNDFFETGIAMHTGAPDVAHEATGA